MSRVRKDRGCGKPSAMNRRGFLRASALGAAAAAGSGLRAHAQDKAKPPLVMVKHPDATNEQGDGNPDIVRGMIARAMTEFTGQKSVKDAWSSLFKPDDVVGVKFNLRGGRKLSTQVCTSDCIIAGLKAAGVREDNIIFWDAEYRELRTAGYTARDEDGAVRYTATDAPNYAPGRERSKEADKEALKDYHESEAFRVADKDVFFTKILTQRVTALINVPLIKDHMIAGVTCSMKNHYGSILNPRDLHGDCCDPYLADLNTAPVIRDKTRLILVDGLRSLYNGGPRDKPPFRWRQNTIIAGADTVAVDALALRILEEKRKEKGMPPVTPRAKYIATAAARGLGTADLDKVDLREIELG